MCLERILKDEQSVNTTSNYGYILTGVGQLGGAALLISTSPLTVWGFPLLALSSLAGSGTAAYQYRINRQLAEATVQTLQTDAAQVEELKQELRLFNDTALLQELLEYFRLSSQVMDAFLGLSITTNVYNGFSMYALLSSGSYVLLSNALSVSGGIFSALFGALGLASKSGLEKYIHEYAIPSLEDNVSLIDKLSEKLKNSYNKSLLFYNSLSAGNNAIDSDESFTTFLVSLRCFDCKSFFSYTYRNNFVCNICEEFQNHNVQCLICKDCDKQYCSACLNTDILTDNQISNMIKYFPCVKHECNQIVSVMSKLMTKCWHCDHYIGRGKISFECAYCRKESCANIYCFFSREAKYEDRNEYLHLNLYKNPKKKIKKMYSQDYTKYINKNSNKI